MGSGAPGDPTACAPGPVEEEPRARPETATDLSKCLHILFPSDFPQILYVNTDYSLPLV